MSAAAWTPDKGWHTVTEAERQQMQRQIVARITQSPATQRALAGQLPAKEIGR